MRGDPCAICTGVKYSYLFASHGGRIIRCSGCGLLRRSESRLKPQTQFSAEGVAIAPQAAHVDIWKASETEQEAAARYAAVLKETGITYGNVALFTSDPEHPLAGLLAEQKYNVKCFTSLEELKTMQEGDAACKFHCIYLIEALETSANPNHLLSVLWTSLADDGVVINFSSSLDSWSAKFFGSGWPGWRPEVKHYFSRTTLQLLLERTGFHKIRMMPDCRLYTLEHVLQRAKMYPGTLLTGFIKLFSSLVPKQLRQAHMRIESSRVIAIAQKNCRRCPRKLSIVMPVFNEKNSFEHTFKQVLAKEVAGIEEKEIIIVESNSTDGTRELVRSCEDIPGVTVVYEERPRGKGHAVRTGLARASGEIVLIQDADMEYDVEDYDELIEPIVDYRQVFVLGSRNSGTLKMRTFTDKPDLALLMNFGQVLFTTLLNVLYGRRMSDPFTMYKVFRRECLYGLNFECNRFDFDFELVIKLLRKGYVPFEVPVNYESRSYSEGKKVTLVRDPLTWIRASFKYRFVSPFNSQWPPYVTDSHLSLPANNVKTTVCDNM